MANVIELIKQDHREVEGLFTEFQQTNDEKVATKICEELDAHAEAEEKVFYPAVKELQGGKPMVSHAEDEHSEAKQLIGRIKQTRDLEHLSELVTELQQAVQEHVQEEESEMLPKAEQELGSEKLTQLGPEFEQAKGVA